MAKRPSGVVSKSLGKLRGTLVSGSLYTCPLFHKQSLFLPLSRLKQLMASFSKPGILIPFLGPNVTLTPGMWHSTPSLKFLTNRIPFDNSLTGILSFKYIKQYQLVKNIFFVNPHFFKNLHTLLRSGMERASMKSSPRIKESVPCENN